MLRKSKMPPKMGNGGGIDSTAVSIFVVVLVELTNTVFVNSTNITTNIETAALSIWEGCFTKRMRLGALLFELWPFENSTGPWEGLLPSSQYLSIQPI